MRKVFLLGLFIIFSGWGCHPDPTVKQITAKSKASTQPQDTVVAHTYDRYGLIIDSLEVNEHKVRRNESLYRILDKYDFSPREIYSITQQAREVVDVQSIKPGQTYLTYSSADSSAELSRMVWQPNPIEFVVFDWRSDSVQVYKAARVLSTKRTVTSGEINNSLYETISEQDASPLLTYKLAEIFAWQINFFGLRKGDSFKALYNKKFVDNNFYGIGKVKAAEFTHRGEKYRAYEFHHGQTSGYFTESGESVQKALLKAPFKFSQRISSHFSHSRYHPILKKRMPHYGVDYAAPYGTPVLSVGDGTVTEAQYRGANGNIVKITHNSTYRTAYLHLKGFASGIYPEATVKQGEVIGYVGSTGRSTGSHLDYRLYRNNGPVNPLTVELPSSDAVPDSLMDEFLKVRDQLDRQLNETTKGDNPQEKNSLVTQVN